MTTYRKILLGLLFVLLGVLPLRKIFADDSPSPVQINFEVEGPTASIYNQSLSAPACSTPNNASSTINGFCAFAASGLPVDATWSSYGALVNGINGTAGDSSNYWLWFLNGDIAPVGIDSYILKPGDNVLWSLKTEPLKISISNTSPAVNSTSTVTVLGFDPIKFDFEPVAGAIISGTSLVTDASGKAGIFATSTNPITFNVTASGYINSQQFTITPKPESITLTIRGSSGSIFTGTINLPDASAANLQIAPTNSTSTIPVSPRSVLGVLENLQTSSATFNISKLSYYKSYNSFLIDCITAPANGTTPDCYSWTDAVNGIYPVAGIDHQLLKNGDAVYLFFGPSHKTVLSDSSVAVGQTFTATALQYELSSGNYIPLSGVTLGVGTQNADYSFTEIATSTVDSSGKAKFAINNSGTFSVGIKEDYYAPSASITITSGGGGGGVTHTNFSLPKALAYLSSNQNTDGSFANDLETDWTAVAFGAANPGSAKNKLINYLKKSHPELSEITDYERHAMALESLGINPYNGSSIDCISPIVKSFDGNQIGSGSDADDIFGLIALQHTGFTSTDSLIQAEIKFILSKQKSDGSWDESPDMTAAAIQSLGIYYNINGVNDALGKAVPYLISQEKPDASWGNVDSTSWVQTAINGIIEAHTPGLGSEDFWKSPSGLYPTDALANYQKAAGNVDSADSIWSTAYALVAASGKSWFSALGNFSKTTTTPLSGGIGGGDKPLATSTLATLPITATSTATSTLPEIKLILPTTTPAVLSTTTPTLPVIIPKHIPVIRRGDNSHNLVKKSQSLNKSNEGQVLGQQTSQPEPAKTEPTSDNTSKPKGFWRNIWDSVSSFFSDIF